MPQVFGYQGCVNFKKWIESGLKMEEIGFFYNPHLPAYFIITALPYLKAI